MTDQPWVIADDDRYSGFRLIGWWEQQRLLRARILVVGAGALGNEVLKNLALLGIGTIYIVDCDNIEESNLTRSVLFRARDCGRPKAEAAAAAILDLSPDTRVRAFKANVITDIGLGLFRDVDVVIGCLDNREARLWVNRSCWKVGRPWIDGGIQEINGVAKVFVPPDSACYECAMTETDYQLINLRYSCPLLRREDLQTGKVPTAPTIASMIGGLQTQEALKLIHGLAVSAGCALVYNGVANEFYKTRFPFREDCLSHETYPEPREIRLSATRHTAADLFRVVRESGCQSGPLALALDRDLVTTIECPPCGLQREIMRPATLVVADEASCPGCGQTMRPRLVHRIEECADLADRLLSELGVPPYDIVRIAGAGDEHVYLLAGDRERVLLAAPS